MKKLIEKKGITLVALVVTLIILIILAGISINLILGENGVVERALAAKEQVSLAEQEEKDRLNQLYSSIMVATGDGAEITISMQDLNTLIENKVKEQLNNVKTETVPAGTVISYITGTAAPEGYLKCDGTVYNISEYQTLADSIKNGLGSYNYYGGDGVTTFAVPNLQGEFLRGTGTNSYENQGSGTAVGKHQNATLFNNMWVGSSDFGIMGNTSNEHVEYYDSRENALIGRYITGTVVSSTSLRMKHGRITSRPTNTSVLYCIKY